MISKMAVKMITGLLVLLSLLTLSTGEESRFSCRSCQYQNNMKDTSCIYAAENLTAIQYRLKCPGGCMTHSIINKETRKATYMFRGCSNNEVEKSECLEHQFEYRCNTFCADHYCNILMDFEDYLPGSAQSLIFNSILLYTALVLTLIMLQ